MKTADNLIRFRVDNIDGYPEISWAVGMSFCVPEIILKKIKIDTFIHNGALILPKKIPSMIPDTWESVRSLSLYTEIKPISSALPIPYQKIPPWLRSVVASVIGKIKRQQVDKWASSPLWPLDLSADFLMDLSGQPNSLCGQRTPVILSHDLDSSEGLKNLVMKFLDLEEKYEAKSENYIVPCAWKINIELLEEVKVRGHDIGIHGYDHNNITPFCSSLERKKRLKSAFHLIEKFNIAGYRAPSLLRTKALLHDLSEIYLYDSSIPTSGGLFPVPNNGCASARPFAIGNLIEIPLSMPRDGSLRFLGYQPDEIRDLWIKCAENISNSGGVVVLLTHCENRFSGNERMLSAYEEFLEYISKSNKFTWSSSRQVLTQCTVNDNKRQALG